MGTGSNIPGEREEPFLIFKRPENRKNVNRSATCINATIDFLVALVKRINCRYSERFNRQFNRSSRELFILPPLTRFISEFILYCFIMY